MREKLGNLSNKIKDYLLGGLDGDNIMLAIVGVISIIGLAVLFSASTATSFLKYSSSYYIIAHQMVGFFIGIAVFYFFSRLDYHIWKKYTWVMLIFSIILLSLVFIPGLKAGWGKSRSWISIFGFSLQPSELVKLFFLMYLAAWIEKSKDKLKDVTEGFMPFIVVLVIIVVLMLLQPDFGTLSIISAVSLIVFFVGGGKKRHIALIIAAGLIGIFIMIQLKPYQKDRFRCLLDPSHDSQERCYQVNQALIAVGSGGIFGRGFGASRQKFMYLPEVTSDSIFAVAAEELGFIACVMIIMLYLGLFLRGWRISKLSKDEFGKLLAIGIVSWISIQAVINIGGIINLIPLTGVPLPLISYGGSSIIATFMAVGVLYNISKQIKKT